jgi:predicted regulator of Ras-like GTPase activity (Roadblock/LC7/MglB family)
MNETEVQGINAELKKLENFSGIVGIAFVNRNGLLISSRLPRDIDEWKFGAMAATMYEAIETATSTLDNNQIIHFTVEFDGYQIIIMEVNEKSILVSLMDLNSNIGLVLIEIEETIKNITKIIGR